MYKNQSSVSELPDHLKSDPLHIWIPENNVELIHEEPTYEIFERRWLNFNLMSEEQKNKSDLKSIELFGKTNKERYFDLLQIMILKKN